MELRLPKLTATNPVELQSQIKGYLYAMTEQLNWALKTIEAKSTTGDTVVLESGERVPVSQKKEKTPGEIFNEIKSLIIKSADIVEAYSEEISKTLAGKYVAVSDFGSYKEETEATFTATSKDIEALFSNTQEIESEVDEINSLITTDGSTTKILSTDAWVKIGTIATEESGHYLYGMEIGQTNEINGEQVETKFAQYTSEGMYLYDGNSPTWSLKLARGTLTVNNAEIKYSLTQGGFRSIVQSDGSIIKKWIGV